MTEYETAIIALRETGNLIALGVGLLQAALIAGGLLVMRGAAKQRDKMHDEVMANLKEQRQDATEQHHETMRGLEALIASLKEQRQDATEQHRETMTALQEQHRATMLGLETLRATLKDQRQDATEQHRATMRGLEALIERTARPAS